MAISTSYDPETLEFLADQAAWRSSGRKTYSPIPHSRIPSTPRRKLKPAAAAEMGQQGSVVGPTYLLFVPPGKERTYWARLHNVSRIRALLPLTFRNEPVYPGWLFLTIPDAEFPRVATLLKEWRWGFLNPDPIAPDLLQAVQSHVEEVSVAQNRGGSFGDDHPLWQLAQALIHHYGWHGTWNEMDGWQLQTATGVAIEHAGWNDLWRALYTAWQAGTAMAEIVQKHRDVFVGVAFPITIHPGRTQDDWSCEWLGLSGLIPAIEHRGIRMASHTTTGWGVLLRSDALQFSLVHQDLARQLTAYRMPVRDILRVPGERTALCVAQLSDVARMHARHISKSLGWQETWGVVSPSDPLHLIRFALQPKSQKFFRDSHIVSLTQIPKPRQVWVDRVNQWLAPDWTIVS